MYVVLSILFGSHPQPIPSLTMGHIAMSVVFLSIAVFEAAVLTIGHWTNVVHTKSRLKALNSATNSCSLPIEAPVSSCECKCGVKSR